MLPTYVTMQRTVHQIIGTAFSSAVITPGTTRTAPATDHDVLCVTPAAPPEVIRAAYKALSRLRHPDAGGSTEEMQRINAAYDRLSSANGRPMLNRALRETYPPGSTFKIVTAAAALESGQYGPDSQVNNAAELDLPLTDATLPNFDGAPCSSAGRATLTDALKRSCNAAFGQIGLDLGAQALREQAAKFGFNDAFEVPMRSVASRFPEDPDEPQTAQSAISTSGCSVSKVMKK